MACAIRAQIIAWVAANTSSTATLGVPCAIIVGSAFLMAQPIVPISIPIRALVDVPAAFWIAISVRRQVIAVRALILPAFLIAIAVNAKVIARRAGEAFPIVALRAIAAIRILPAFLMAQVILAQDVSVRAYISFCAVRIAEAVGPQIITLLAHYALPVVALRIPCAIEAMPALGVAKAVFTQHIS
jgi:hypothetical protein